MDRRIYYVTEEAFNEIDQIELFSEYIIDNENIESPIIKNRGGVTIETLLDNYLNIKFSIRIKGINSTRNDYTISTSNDTDNEITKEVLKKMRDHFDKKKPIEEKWDRDPFDKDPWDRNPYYPPTGPRF